MRIIDALGLQISKHTLQHSWFLISYGERRCMVFVWKQLYKRLHICCYWTFMYCSMLRFIVCVWCIIFKSFFCNLCTMRILNKYAAIRIRWSFTGKVRLPWRQCCRTYYKFGGGALVFTSFRRHFQLFTSAVLRVSLESITPWTSAFCFCCKRWTLVSK